MSRHDPAIAPRIVLVGEVWWPMVLADHLLRQRAAKLQKNTIEETTKYLADAYQG